MSRNDRAAATRSHADTDQDTVDLSAFNGETHSQVLAENEASPTGLMSMSGAFPTRQEAIEVYTRHICTAPWTWNGATVRFHDLDTKELLSEVTIPEESEV